MNVSKSIVLWIIIFLLCIVFAMRVMGRKEPLELSITEFLALAELNAPAQVDIADAGPAPGTEKMNAAFRGEVIDKSGKLTGELSPNFASTPQIDRKINQLPYDPEGPIAFVAEYGQPQGEKVLNDALQYNIDYRYEEQSSIPYTLLTLMIPVLLIVALWILFLRQIQNSGNKAMSFGKSRAKLIAEGQVKVNFDDVAGVEEAKEELQEVVDFLRDPKKYSRLGGRIPKGVLLFGPPGTGKTLLAKAVAGEANVPFFSISGSDFVEMFVGVGASRVRDLFEQAKKSKPCLIFIDEIDAVGRQRFAGVGGGHDEREQTLNQLLVEMDGFSTNEGVILIAATNRPDVLDPALMRPGRFDRQITVDYPDVEGRVKILKVHAKTVKLEGDVDMLSVAKGTPGFSGADLANIINEAALLAARRSRESVSQKELEEAKDRVMMGPERRSLKITEDEKRATAIHEAGHAIAARFTPGADPVHKITIVPRGRSLGLTSFLPLEEKHSRTKSELKAGMVAMLGGLAAEKIAFGENGTGVGNDLQRVTQLSRRMICEFGMSDVLGPRTFGETRSSVFLGRDMANENRDYGEDVARVIDEETRLIVNEAYERAVDILTQHRDLLDRVTDALVERETVDAHELELLIEGKELPPFKPDAEDKEPPNKGEPEAAGEKEKKKPPRLTDFLDNPRQVPG